MSTLLDHKAVSELMDRQDAEEIVSAVQRQIAAERKRREDFYDWLDEDKKAEFIGGEIVVHAPVMKRHADTTLLLTMLLSAFVRVHKSGYVGTEKLLVRLKRDDFEPDVAYWSTDQAKDFTPEQLFFGPPTFVAEVLSGGTEGYDRGRKYESYAANGVREYWIVDAKLQRVECYGLTDSDTYLHRETISIDGRLMAVHPQGFSIACRAIFDEEVNLDALAEILAARGA